LHYRHDNIVYTETFPFNIADEKWHKIALSVSAIHIDLYIDCNHIYKREIHEIDRDLYQHSNVTLWLGQRYMKHFLYRVSSFFLISYHFQIFHLNCIHKTLNGFLSVVNISFFSKSINRTNFYLHFILEVLTIFLLQILVFWKLSYSHTESIVMLGKNYYLKLYAKEFQLRNEALKYSIQLKKFFFRS
jgi:hypothetical protein